MDWTKRNIAITRCSGNSGNIVGVCTPTYGPQADNQKRAADEARRNREETERQANAARLAELDQRHQQARSTEELPLVVELRAPKEPEGGRQYSAQEETELDRLAARLAPKIIQRIERNRNISIRRKVR